MNLLILGLLIIVIGVIIFIKGKIPFVRVYHGVHEGKEALHCRIESSIMIYMGIVFCVWEYKQLASGTAVILLVLGCVIGGVLEVVLKVLK